MSKRRTEIEAWLRRHGLAGARAAERAALVTRQGKQQFRESELSAAWAQQAKAFGFDNHSAIRMLGQGQAKTEAEKQGKAKHAAATARAGLLDHNARFTRNELLERAAVEAQCQGVGIDEVLKATEQELATNPEVVRLADKESVPSYTTRRMLRLERQAIETAQRLSSRYGHLVSQDRIDRVTADYLKGRSRGVCLVLAFQDIEGFQEASGTKLAGEIIAQCSNKALLRCQSKDSADWASGLLGQYECLEVFRSDSSRLGSDESRSEQRVVKDAVLPSEFYELPVTSRENGLTGYYITAEHGAHRTWVAPEELDAVVVPEEVERREAIRLRPADEQWLVAWDGKDLTRLGLHAKHSQEAAGTRQRLRLRKPNQVVAPPASPGQARVQVTDDGVLREVTLPKAVA